MFQLRGKLIGENVLFNDARMCTGLIFGIVWMAVIEVILMQLSRYWIEFHLDNRTMFKILDRTANIKEVDRGVKKFFSWK